MEISWKRAKESIRFCLLFLLREEMRSGTFGRFAIWFTQHRNSHKKWAKWFYLIATFFAIFFSNFSMDFQYTCGIQDLSRSDSWNSIVALFYTQPNIYCTFFSFLLDALYRSGVVSCNSFFPIHIWIHEKNVCSTFLKFLSDFFISLDLGSS